MVSARTEGDGADLIGVNHMMIAILELQSDFIKAADLQDIS